MENVKIYRSIAKLRGIEMFYLDTKTQGPVILCLHGRWGRAEVWADFIQNYGTHYRIIAPDQRGHGLSSKPEAQYTSREMAEDVIELLDFLDIDSVILVGHSMGGGVAGYLAAVHPQYIKAVAILDKSAARPAKPHKQLKEESEPKDPMTEAWPLPFATLSEAMSFIRQNTGSDLEYQYFMNSLTETVAGYDMMFCQKAIARGIANIEDWFCLLPDIKCPTLLIRAKNHEAVPDEDFIKMQALIPDCLAYEMSHPDHNVHLANKEEFYRYFDEFIKKISASQQQA